MAVHLDQILVIKSGCPPSNRVTGALGEYHLESREVRHTFVILLALLAYASVFSGMSLSAFYSSIAVNSVEFMRAENYKMYK